MQLVPDIEFRVAGKGQTQQQQQQITTVDLNNRSYKTNFICII